MNRTILLVAFFICLHFTTKAQNNVSTNLMQIEAQKELSQKKTTPARSLYLHASQIYLQQQNYDRAVECCTVAATLYFQDKLYKEALDLCRTFDSELTKAEQKNGKSRADLHFKLQYTRFTLFTQLVRADMAEETLEQLKLLAHSARNESITNDYNFCRVYYNYTFGNKARGDALLNPLIQKYKAKKNYKKITECYFMLLKTAHKSGNTDLAAKLKYQYSFYKELEKKQRLSDSLRYATQQRLYNHPADASEKSSFAIKNHNFHLLYVIIGLLGIALLVTCIILIRARNRLQMQKQALQVAQDMNEQKSLFILNISKQISTKLASVNTTHAEIKDLKHFLNHIAEITDLENSLAEIYPLQDIEIALFCEKLINTIRGKVCAGVTVKADAPRVFIKGSEVELNRVLTSLLMHAASNTPADGKIVLEFKKKGGKSHQFTITNTGNCISSAKQRLLFNVFAQDREYANDDDLELAACSLIAIKMNGKLSIDETYTKGCRFILEINH